MRVEELKNYGKSLPECSRTISDATMKKVKKIAMDVVRRRLGLIKLLTLPFLISREHRRLLAMDLSTIREKIKDEKFITEMINEAALFCAIKRMSSEKEAIDIHYKIMDETQNIIMDEIIPSVADVKAFRDPYKVSKKYFLSIMKADSKEKYHIYNMAEDGKKAFQVNITFCAWYEIKKALGIPEAALPNCYSDDVYLPSLTSQLGIRFIRKGTIAKGKNHCDFRFEKV